MAGSSSDDGGDSRRFANNPFARALGRQTAPDDDKATSPVMYVAVGLLSLVLVAVFVAALVLPPLLTHTLILRGARTGHYGMLALGLVMAFMYMMILYSVGKRLMGRPAGPPPPPPSDDE
jgi:hypothetical protein